MIPVIIPYYKRSEQLERCLACLRGQSLPVQPFVRDNTTDNIFFTAAVNEGLRRFLEQPCDYMVVLNQDMYLQPSAIETLAAFLDGHPRCGIAAPLHLHPTRPDYVICGGGKEAFPAGRWFHGPLAEFQHDRSVAWADGACLMLRKEMVRQVGLFDENFVFIGSDSDYCFTARRRGWEVWVVTQARGIHMQGASSRPADQALEVRKLKDMIHFADKWLASGFYERLAWPSQEVSSRAVAEQANQMRQALAQVQP